MLKYLKYLVLEQTFYCCNVFLCFKFFNILKNKYLITLKQMFISNKTKNLKNCF